MLICIGSLPLIWKPSNGLSEKEESGLVFVTDSMHAASHSARYLNEVPDYENEHGGNLNEAVNAHFSEEDRNAVQEAPAAAAQNDFMDIDDSPAALPRGPPSLLSSARGLNPFSLLDPSFRRRIFDSRSPFEVGSELPDRAPFVSHPREVREIPIEVKDGSETSGPSGPGPRIEDVTHIEHAEGPEIRGAVIIDDDDDIPASGQRNEQQRIQPSAPIFDDAPNYGEDIEEEMIRAAIEASKKDIELQNKQDVAHEVAEQDRALRKQGVEVGDSLSDANKPVEVEELRKIAEPNGRRGFRSSNRMISSQHKEEAGSSSFQDDVEELEEMPLVRHRSRRRSSSSLEACRERKEAEASPPSSPPQRTTASQPQLNGNTSHLDEWGGISSEEHDEAVMLEAAMFGGIPDDHDYHFPYAPHQLMRSGLDRSRSTPRPPSPATAAQRAIREQQDNEYLASLQADREKEFKAMEEEKAAREAALEEMKRKEEESHRKLEEEQELERQLAAKEASLPEEPPLDDENAVTLLVRLPDGSRRGRRFLKSHKLQSLFDFIDVGRGVKPGAYRVVRPYPRRAFGDGESSMTLGELGLTSKQEALFLELI